MDERVVFLAGGDLDRRQNDTQKGEDDDDDDGAWSSTQSCRCPVF